jgi:DnaJ-class molecular chaperone
MKNHYVILGLSMGAEDIVIRAAYKSLAQKYHPDKWAGDPNYANQKMIEINKSYEILSDPSKRKLYDSQLNGDIKKEDFRVPNPPPYEAKYSSSSATSSSTHPKTSSEGINKNSFMVYFFVALFVLWLGSAVYESGVIDLSTSGISANDRSSTSNPSLTYLDDDRSSNLTDCIRGGEKPCILTKNLNQNGKLIQKGVQIFVTSETDGLLTIMLQDAGNLAEIDIHKNVLLEHIK